MTIVRIDNKALRFLAGLVFLVVSGIFLFGFSVVLAYPFYLLGRWVEPWLSSVAGMPGRELKIFPEFVISGLFVVVVVVLGLFLLVGLLALVYKIIMKAGDTFFNGT